MFKSLWLLSLVMVLLITSCKESKITAPPEVSWDNSDWVICVNCNSIEQNTDNEVEYSISARWLGPVDDLGNYNSISVTLDDVMITLYSTSLGLYENEVMLTSGRVYSFVFSVNSTVTTSGELKVPSFCTVEFPSVIYLKKDNHVLWDVESNNMCQYLNLSSFHSFNQDLFDAKIAYLKNSLRKAKVKGNEVQNYGQYTIYYLAVCQLNFLHKNRVYTVATQGMMCFYGRNGELSISPLSNEIAFKLAKKNGLK